MYICSYCNNNRFGEIYIPAKTRADAMRKFWVAYPNGHLYDIYERV